MANNRIAVLGDMRELGEAEAEFHRATGAYFAQKGGEVLFTFGELARNMANGAIEGGVLPSNVVSLNEYQSEEAVAAMGEAICQRLERGDIFLVKASRAIGAERVLAYVKQKILKTQG